MGAHQQVGQGGWNGWKGSGGNVTGTSKYGCVALPNGRFLGKRPCDQNLGPFFLNFETPSKYAGKDSSSNFAGLPFKGIFLWGDDYRIIIHFEVINIQLTLYQPAFWKGGNSHPCHLYSQENLHVP